MTTRMRISIEGLIIVLLVLAALSAMTGCTAGPQLPPPVVVAKTVEVDVPVIQPCIKASDVPAMPPLVGPLLNGDARHDYDVTWPALVDTRVALAAALNLIKPCTIPGS